MYLVINKCVTAVKVSNISGHYLRKRLTLDIGVLGYIVYFNIRNTLPKSGTFLLGHPVYIPSYVQSNYILSQISYVSKLLTEYRAGDKIKNEMGWACGAYG